MEEDYQASVTRRTRQPGEQDTGPIRSLAYSSPLIEEILQLQVGRAMSINRST